MRERFSYGVSEGMRNIRQNKLSALMSAGIVMLSLLVMNLIFSVSLVIRDNVGNLRHTAQVEVFCYPGIAPEQAAALGEMAGSLDGVTAVTPRSQEENYQLFRQYLDDKSYLLDEYDSSIISSSFVLDLRDISYGDAVVEAMTGAEGVQSVQFPGRAARAVTRLAGWLDVLNVALSIVLCAASAVVITNTVRIALLTREKEIGIMKLIGATDDYIRTPFVAESMMLALAGAAVALLLQVLLYSLGSAAFGRALVNLGISYVTIPSPWRVLLIAAPIDLALSALLGWLGCRRSLRKYLEV